MFGLTYEEELSVHDSMSRGMIWVAIPTFLITYFVIPSPYGKTLSPSGFGTGIVVPANISWFLFEVPNLIWVVVCFFNRNQDMFRSANVILLLLFFSHYINRSIIYPLRMGERESKPIPIEVASLAFVFTSINGYVQAQNLCQFQDYPIDYLNSFPFLLGVFIFGIGFSINFQSDSILASLRKQRLQQNKQQYLIPYGGFFAYLSAPHYFGELVEWTGFAIACNNSLAGWAFVVYTAANLIPRGVEHHKWYKRNFLDYPINRKAVIPFVW